MFPFGTPKHEYVYMTTTCINEHSKQEIVNERFATALLSHNDRDFWSEVKRIRSHKTCQSNVVDKSSTPECIADFFADKYEDLYSCVSYSVDDVKKISDELNMALTISVLLVTLMW